MRAMDLYVTILMNVLKILMSVMQTLTVTTLKAAASALVRITMKAMASNVPIFMNVPETDNCSDNAVCDNNEGSIKCTCNDDFELADNVWVDID